MQRPRYLRPSSRPGPCLHEVNLRHVKVFRDENDPRRRIAMRPVWRMLKTHDMPDCADVDAQGNLLDP